MTNILKMIIFNKYIIILKNIVLVLFPLFILKVKREACAI